MAPAQRLGIIFSRMAIFPSISQRDMDHERLCGALGRDPEMIANGRTRRRLGGITVAAVALIIGACAAKTPKPKPAAKKASVKPAAKKATAKKTPAKPTKRKPTKPKPTPKANAAGAFTPDSAVLVCPKMKVSNRPKTDRNRRILSYKPFVTINKVKLAVAPQNGACFSSGFGKRNGRNHRGIDYYAKPGPMIHAAGAGIIKEAEWHDGYGKMVVIDHGKDVYTRYAHLKGFNRGIRAGAKVKFGTPLGVMGKTSKYKVALHLHYEVLTGPYHPRKKSFGLKAVNIMKLLK